MVKQIWQFIGSFRHSTEVYSIELSPEGTGGLILDIGGGGQGIISRLNGKHVITIDKSEKELRIKH